MFFLPKILEWLTGKPRYLPEIKWSSKSWTHNVFRFYELIFWRKFGIRAEMSAHAWRDKDGKSGITYQYHSFEAVCAGVETIIRDFLTWRPKFRVVKIWVPVFSSTIGLPKASPFMFAIAFDNSRESDGLPSNPQTFSYTVTGSNPILWAGTTIANNTVTAVSYNSVGLTQLDTYTINGSGPNGVFYAHYLPGPATGSNTVSISFGGIAGYNSLIGSYTGVKQTSPVDNNDKDPNYIVGTSYSKSLTVNTDQC